MAFVNPNRPAGLSPVKTLSGSDWIGKGNMYCILASDSNAYYPGDPVTLTATGDSRGIPGVTLATAGNPITGVMQAGGVNPDGGPYINVNNLALTSIPATKTQNYYIYVLDDPFMIYEIQEGGAGTNLTQAAVGNNANLLYVAPAAGSSVSGVVLNNASVATTITLNLKIMNFARRIDNQFVTTPTTGGGAQKWWVMINNHSYRAGTTGV